MTTEREKDCCHVDISIGNEYLESRDSTCDDEDSRHEITLRYRRTA